MKEFLRGLGAAIPIASGYVPVAITFGLVVTSGGLSPLDAVGASLLVFAGAAQFLAAGMFISGAGALQIIVSGTLLNLRHLLMSSVVANNLTDTPRWKRGVLAFGITDEVFGIAGRLAITGRSIGPAYLLGLETGAYLSWITGTLIGATTGNILPEGIQNALGVALYALFAALLAGIIRDATVGSPRSRMVGAAIVGGGLNWALRSSVGFLPGLSPGVAFPIAMICAALLFTIKPREAAE